MKKLSLALFLTVLLPASLASAKTYPHDQAKVSITIPDAWKVDAGDNNLTANTSDETTYLVFIVLDAADLDKATAGIDKELDKVMKNVSMKPGEQVDINGMKSYAAEGTGEIEGKKVDVGVIMIQTKSGKVLLGFGFGETGKYEPHQKEINDIFQSIKPI